jgi:hypothetical protein
MGTGQHLCNSGARVQARSCSWYKLHNRLRINDLETGASGAGVERAIAHLLAIANIQHELWRDRYRNRTSGIVQSVRVLR